MEAINLYLQYLYAPIAIALYYLHIKLVRLDAKLHDYKDFKSDIYALLTELRKDVHYLVKVREDEKERKQ